MAPTPTPAPAGGADVQQLAQMLGIDLSALPAPAVEASGSTARVFMGQKLASVAQGQPVASMTGQTNPLTGHTIGPSVQTLGQDGDSFEGPYPTYEDDTLTLDQAKLRFNSMSPQEVKDLAQKLVSAGVLDENYSYGDIEDAWDGLVEKAARNYAAGVKLSPFDMITRYYGTDGGGQGTGSATTRKQVESTLNLSDNDEARTMLSRLMTADLGRKPTDKEVDTFQASLNLAQTRAPNVNTSTTTYDAKGHPLTTNNVLTGGVDEGGFTQRYEQKNFDGEYAKYQAATTYANALFDALKSPV